MDEHKIAKNTEDISALNSNLTNMLLNLEQILQDITYQPGNERTIIRVDIASLTSKYKMVIPVAVDAATGYIQITPTAVNISQHYCNYVAHRSGDTSTEVTLTGRFYYLCLFKKA